MTSPAFRLALLALAWATAPAPTLQADLADKLVPYWPLDGHVNDLIGGYHGQPQGDIKGDSYLPGPVGKALFLDGRDDFVEVVGGPGVPFDRVPRASSFWLLLEGSSRTVFYTRALEAGATV